MSKRWISRVSLMLTLIMTLATCTVTATAENGIVRPQDDLYAAVNAEWLATAVIPANKVMIGGFIDLNDEVEALLLSDFATISDETAAAFEALPEFIKLYAMASDYETRNAQGAEPLAPYLKAIDALTSLDALNDALPGLILNNMPTPLDFGVAADMGNAQYYALYAVAPKLLLPDTSYYNTPTGDYLLEAFGQVAGALLQQCGYDDQTVAQIVEQAIEFDALIAPHIPSAEEASDYSSVYNPTTFDNFTASSVSLDLHTLISALVPSVPDQVIIAHPKYMAVLDQVVNESNLPLLRSWMKFWTVYSIAPLLSEEMETIAAMYAMILSGQAELDEPGLRAFRLAYSFFDGPIGVYYAQTYFGEEAKRDVIAMVEQIIQVYRSRLQTNDWLSPETIEIALHKLESMALQIGYPDKLQPEFSLLHVTSAEDGGTVVSNAKEFTRITAEANMAKYGQKTDQGYWVAGAATVNAFYQPMENTITFPAAILQAPFYSLEQSASRNLGGMGAVIAHEITHAFDSNGSKFDEYGSLANWWTDADQAVYAELIQAIIAQFDGIPYGDGVVNGTLTVSENISDLGGLNSALEVCRSLDDPDLHEFFEGWATIWCSVTTPEIEQLLLAIDVHAPDKLRVNIIASNLDAFYEAYEVKEGDGMYLAPEKRVAIW